MDLKKLEEVAEAMVLPGKGILAADESTGTISSRLSQIDTESSFELGMHIVTYYLVLKELKNTLAA